MLPADDLLREVTAAASQLPIWGQSLRPLIKEDLLRHLREHGIQRYSEVEFKEERQAVMAEVFGTHSDQLKDLQNCLGHVIEEKITNSLLMDVGTADQDALERAVDLAANAAVTLLGRLRHIDARLFVPRLVAARPNDRLRRILWDRLLLKSDSHRPDHAKECSDRPRGLPQDLLGSSDLRLSRSQTAEVERLVAASPETEPTESSVCTAVVLVLVYGVGPANPRRYEGLLSSTKAWDAAVSHCSDLDAGSWIRRRFVDARVDQEATKLVWDELLFAACWSPAAVPKVLAICTRVLLDLIGRPSGVVSGTAFLEALRSRRSDLLEVICGRGSESIAEVSSCSSLPDHLPQYGTSLDHEEPHNGHHNDPSEGVDAATQTEEDLWNGHGRPGLAVEPWSSYVTDLMAKGGGRVGLSVELRDGRRIQLPIINPFGLVDSVSEVLRTVSPFRVTMAFR